MAKAVGISSTTVHKLRAANDLKPHLTRTFKLSNDPQFEEKFRDVIGLYLAPPDNAWCCVAMRKVRFTLWRGRSQACLWALVISRQNPMITHATARSRYSQRWIIS